MSFDDLDKLKSRLEQIDVYHEKVTFFKKKHPDAFSRIMKNWAIN